MCRGEGGHVSPCDLIEDKRGIRDSKSSVGETTHVVGHLTIRSRQVGAFPRVSPLGVPLGASRSDDNWGNGSLHFSVFAGTTGCLSPSKGHSVLLIRTMWNKQILLVTQTMSHVAYSLLEEKKSNGNYGSDYIDTNDNQNKHRISF
jgi:hypothetical protein